MWFQPPINQHRLPDWMNYVWLFLRTLVQWYFQSWQSCSTTALRRNDSQVYWICQLYSQVQLHCGIESSMEALQKTAIITSTSLGLTVLIHHSFIIFISYCFYLHSYHTLHSLYLEWLFDFVLCELSNKKRLQLCPFILFWLQTKSKTNFRS